MSINPFCENNRWEDVQILKEAFDCSPDNILIIDPQLMNFVDANKTALTSLGYTKEELLNLKPEDIDAVYTSEMMSTAFNSILISKEQHAIIPTKYRRKDKSSFEAEVHLRTFEKNNKVFILVSATDTSVLKKAQQELKFHSALFNNISDAIISTDENFRITSYNKYAEEIFGWTAQEAIGKYTDELTAFIYPGLTRQQARDYLLGKGNRRFEVISHKKNGETFPALISTGLLKDNSGKVTGTVSIIRDLTEEKKKEGEIAYLADLVNKVNEAIISVDSNYDIVSWNNGAENIYGFRREEVTGRSIFNLWIRSDLFGRKEEILTTLRETGYWKGEITHYHKDDTQKWTLVSASVMKDENSIITGFVVVAQDITEGKKLEEELRKLNEHLEERVKEKTGELTNAFERITDGFIVFDDNWNYTYINKNAAQIIRREPKELIGKNVWEILPETAGSPIYLKYHEAMAEQKVVRVQGYYERYQKWFESLLYPSPKGLSVYFRDITDTKNTERALEESELRYRTLVETAQEGIWQVDENNITTFANEYLASLFGYTAKEMIGKNAFDFLSDENREKALKNIEDRKKGISDQHELTLFNKQHQPIHTLIQSTPLFKEGKFAGFISMFLDITQRKKAEEQLVANEKRFRALIENSSDGIVLLSSEGIILYISLSGEKIVGYKKEEIVGTNRLNYFHPADEKKIYNSLEDTIKNPAEVKKLELRYKLPDGSYKWLECNYSNSLNDPYINAIIVNFRDITERKNAEKQVQQNEKQLSLIYNSSLDAMWLLQIEGKGKYRYQAVNNAYAKITGIEKDKTIGKYFGEVFPLKNLEEFNQSYSEAIESGQIKKFITCNQLPAGIITAEIRIIPIKNEEGKVVQLLGTANDVTEQKKNQEDLLQMNDQLRELASHLQNIREEERTSMAREIHDELGQQLTVLKMDISWLNKKITVKDEITDKKLKGVLELIDGTINTVRKISAELRPSVLDDLGLAEAIEWQSRDFTKHAGIPVEFTSNVHDNNFSTPVSTVVFRILQEALTNIARHAHATKVVCTLRHLDNFLNLIISDNGIGFDASRKGERKTLGLLGMKERVTMLGGNYNIESETGKGTTILVQVPLFQQ